jgi:hypothetical protein
MTACGTCIARTLLRLACHPASPEATHFGGRLRNPFLKKNPFMSAWLSGANAVAGSMRGHATAQAKRQTATAVTKATKDVFDLWAGALSPWPPKRKTRRRR